VALVAGFDQDRADFLFEELDAVFVRGSRFARLCERGEEQIKESDSNEGHERRSRDVVWDLSPFMGVYLSSEWWLLGFSSKCRV
jgi:hypothetical protein